jgi:hypothetical protein
VGVINKTAVVIDETVELKRRRFVDGESRTVQFKTSICTCLL